MTNFTPNIREAMAAASERLSVFESGRLDCEVLMSSVLDKGREFIYSHPEAPLNGSQLADFNSLVSKRVTGYPVAYLTGYREFWSMSLEVNRSTLIPRPETERLVEIAIDLIAPYKNLDILDLGTGSGALAIALAVERSGDRLTAADISADALMTAAANALRHDISNISFVRSDWFSGLHGSRFDLVLCNPPYVESGDPGFSYTEIRFEPRLALDGGRAGLDAYYKIIPAAKEHLNYNGILILEHGQDQAAAITGILQSSHYTNIRTYSDHAGRDRVTVAYSPG